MLALRPQETPGHQGSTVWLVYVGPVGLNLRQFGYRRWRENVARNVVTFVLLVGLIAINYQLSAVEDFLCESSKANKALQDFLVSATSRAK